MPPGSQEMHDIALADAIARGPRIFNVGGTERVAYGLTKEELKKIYHKEQYNTTTGSRWRSSVYEWVGDKFDHFDQITIPTPERILDKHESLKWSVIFCMINKSQLLDLKLKGEDYGLRTWPSEEYWRHAQTIAYGQPEES